MMIQHLATSTHNVVKTERKPRRNIQYRDVSGAVSKVDNLEFLVDVVPKTTQYGVYRKRKAAEDEAAAKERAKDGDNVEGKGQAKATEPNSITSATTTTLPQTTLPSIPIQSPAARALLDRAHAPKASAQPPSAPPNGTALDPLARKELVPPVPETDAMEVDGGAGADRVADSEGEGDGEEDPAAMQIEMEMRGPPRTNGKAAEESVQEVPRARVSSGGFTAINGR